MTSHELAWWCRNFTPRGVMYTSDSRSDSTLYIHLCIHPRRCSSFGICCYRKLIPLPGIGDTTLSTFICWVAGYHTSVNCPKRLLYEIRETMFTWTDKTKPYRTLHVPDHVYYWTYWQGKAVSSIILSNPQPSPQAWHSPMQMGSFSVLFPGPATLHSYCPPWLCW